MNRVDPKRYGLHARTVLEQIDEQTLALVIDRKSRIIMADGRKILDKVEQIRTIQPDLQLLLKTSAPLCSKTLAFLKQADIQVLPLVPKS